MRASLSQREDERRAHWYIITIFVMLWRGIRFPLRDGKEEGSGSRNQTEDAKIPALRESAVRDSIYMLQGQNRY